MQDLYKKLKKQRNGLAKQGQENFYFFSNIIMQSVFEKSMLIERVHKAWCNKLQNLGEKGFKKKLLLLAQKESLKTTITSINFPLWKLIQPKGNLNKIFLGNAKLENSKGFLSAIRFHLEQNKMFRNCYGDYTQGNKDWTKTAITVNRDQPLVEPTFGAVGQDSGLASQHPNIMIFDDWINEKNTMTSGQLEKGIITFKQAIATAEKESIIIVVGHIFHFKDLYAWLRSEYEDIGEWDIIFDPAIKDGKILLPELYGENGEMLKKKKSELGEILYNAYFLLDPSGTKGRKLKYD